MNNAPHSHTCPPPGPGSEAERGDEKQARSALRARTDGHPFLTSFTAQRIGRGPLIGSPTSKRLVAEGGPVRVSASVLPRKSSFLRTLAATLTAVLASQFLIASNNVGATTTIASLETAQGQFYPVTPFKFLDTRTGLDVPSITTVPSNGTITVLVAGYGGVPDQGVSAVYVNVIALTPAANGYLSVYPTDSPDPNEGTVAFQSGQSAQGSSTVELSAAGTLSFTNHSGGTVNISADVRGYYSNEALSTPGDRYLPEPSQTILDTRTGQGVPGNVIAKMTSGQSLTFSVFGVGSPPPTSSDVAAVVIELGAINGAVAGYLNDYAGSLPSGLPSVLNYNANEADRLEDVIVPTSAGNITVTNVGSGSVDLQVIVHGYYLLPSSPTLSASYAPSLQSQVYLGTIPGNGSATVTELGVDGIPSTSSSVAAISQEVGVISPSANGWLSVVPSTPGTDNNLSVLNFMNNDNADVTLDSAPLTASGFKIYNHSTGSLTLQITLFGYFASPVAPGAIPAVNVSSDGSQVTWSPPTTDGGSPITQYVVTQHPSGTQTNVAGGTTSLTVTNPSTSYTYSAVAQNGTPNSGAASAVTAPAPPLIIGTTSLDAGAQVSIAPPANDGGAPITSEAVSLVNSGGTVIASQSVPPSSSVVTFDAATGATLQDGTAYAAVATATNSVGTSGNSDPMEVLPAPSVSVPVTAYNFAMTDPHSTTQLTTASAPNQSVWSFASNSSVNYETVVTPNLSQIPQYSVITNAQLIMSGGSLPSSSIGLNAFNLTSAITGSNTIADVQAAEDTSGLTGDSLFGTPATMDLTSEIQSWVNGDLPNDGIVVQTNQPTGSNTYTTNGLTASSGIPQVIISYVAPQSPGAPMTLTAAASDSGTLLQWAYPLQQGSSATITGYAVTVKCLTSGATVFSGVVNDTKQIVNGLINADAYQATVQAENAPFPNGGTASTVQFTPSGNPTTTSSISQELNEYLTGIVGLANGAYSTPAAAASGADPANPAQIQTLLSQPNDLILGTSASASVTSSVVDYATSSSGDGLAVLNMSWTNPDGSSGGVQSLYDIAWSTSGGTPVLSTIVNLDGNEGDSGTALPQAVDEVPVAVDTSGNPLLLPMVVPTYTNAAPSCRAGTCIPYDGTDAAKAAAALEGNTTVIPNTVSASDPCTEFVSAVMAMHNKAYGGGDQPEFDHGHGGLNVKWDCFSGLHDSSCYDTNNQKWEMQDVQTGGAYTNWTESWSVAWNLQQFLSWEGSQYGITTGVGGGIGGRVVHYMANLQPGDIVFWDYSCSQPAQGPLIKAACTGGHKYSGVLHDQMVTRVSGPLVNGIPGTNVYVAQRGPAYKSPENLYQVWSSSKYLKLPRLIYVRPLYQFYYRPGL